MDRAEIAVRFVTAMIEAKAPNTDTPKGVCETYFAVLSELKNQSPRMNFKAVQN